MPLNRVYKASDYISDVKNKTKLFDNLYETETDNQQVQKRSSRSISNCQWIDAVDEMSHKVLGAYTPSNTASSDELIRLFFCLAASVSFA